MKTTSTEFTAINILKLEIIRIERRIEEHLGYITSNKLRLADDENALEFLREKLDELQSAILTLEGENG